MAIGALLGLGTSLLGGIFGAIQKGKANRLERNTPRPDAEVSNSLLKNLAEAEQMATIGLPQEVYNNAFQNIQRNQSTAFRTASKTGGTTNIASILRASNDATMGLDMQDAERQRQNQLIEMQQRGVVAQDEQRVWDWNERQKYEQAMAQVAALRGAGNSNIMGAVGSVAQMGISGLFGSLGGGGGVGAIRAPMPGLGGAMGLQGPLNVPASMPGMQPMGGFQPRIGSIFGSVPFAQNTPLQNGGFGSGIYGSVR